jgi:PAS domain S-box-containing protein
MLAEPAAIHWPLVLFFGIIAIGCFAAALYGSQLQRRDTRVGFRAVLVTTGLWLTLQALGLTTVDPGLSNALYLGGLICGLTGVGAWLYFTSAYTGRSYHRNRRYRGLALSVYVGLLATKLTNPLYGLYILTRFDLDPYPHLVVEPQVFYWVSFTLTYTFVGISFYWLLDTFRNSSYPTTGLGVLAVVSLTPVVPRVAVETLPAGALPPVLLGLSFEPLGVAAFSLGVVVLLEDTFRRAEQSGRSEFFETADDATFVYDTDGELVESNRQAASLQSDLDDEFSTIDAFKQAFRAVDQDDGSGVVTFETDGQTRHFDTTVNPMLIGAETVGTVAWVRDVTERQKRKRELELKERAMDEAKVGITISDPDIEDDPLIYVNDGFVEQTGYSREEALGRNCRFLQADDREQSALDDLREGIVAEEPITVELRNYRNNGERFWNRLSVTPVYDDDSTLVNHIGIQQDVTEGKQRTRRLEALFNGTFQFIGLLEPDGTVIRANDTALEFGGFDREDIVGEPFYNASWWTYSEEVNDRLRDALDRGADGEFVRYETEVRGADGLATIDFSVKPVTDDAGDVTLLIVEGRDITARQRYRRNMEVMQRVMRHNMRNDLTKVRGWTKLMSEEADAEKRAEQYETIDEILDKWEAMSKKMKDIRTTLQSPQDPESREESASLIADAVTPIREEYADATVVTDVSNGESTQLPAALQDAVRELVENAVETREDATVEVKVTHANEGWIEIHVKDDGPGMPDIEADVLETGEESSLNHGEGLGLWMVRTIVTQAGGDVSVESTTDGTDVGLRLPPGGPPGVE